LVLKQLGEVPWAQIFILDFLWNVGTISIVGIKSGLFCLPISPENHPESAPGFQKLFSNQDQDA
jgi:hypothetical protein